MMRKVLLLVLTALTWSSACPVHIFAADRTDSDLADGTYFIKDPDGRFWMRGEPYGSAVQLFGWGLPVVVKTANGATTLRFGDTNDWDIFDDGQGLYADKVNPDNRTWKATHSGDGFILQNSVTGRYVQAEGDRVLSAEKAADATRFTLVSPAVHLQAMAEAVSQQAAWEASAQSATATPVISGSAPATTAEKYQGGQWDVRTVYSGKVNITVPGLYRLTMQAFYRMTDNATSFAMHTSNTDCPPVYVFFGDAKVPIASVHSEANTSTENCYKASDGKYYPDGQTSALNGFKEGHYVNTVWANIDEPGEYAYGIQYIGWAGDHQEWTCYTTESVTLTRYSFSQSEDFVQAGVHYYLGTYTTPPTIELTDDVPVADLTQATMAGATVRFTNPNGLIFAKSGQVSAGQNVVVDGTCNRLVLADGHPFQSPRTFTATTATYTLSAVAGGRYATLLLPYRVTSLPGKAYVLDRDINLLSGTLRGTEVTSIEANSPVLVTAAGNYGATGVGVAVVTPGSVYSNGELTGTYTAGSTVPDGSYVLQVHGNEVAFYLVNGYSPAFSPFRAYIRQQPSASNVFRPVFDGDATGLREVDGTADGHALFNLSGQRVAVPTRGIYVIDGKKVVIHP